MENNAEVASFEFNYYILGQKRVTPCLAPKRVTHCLAPLSSVVNTAVSYGSGTDMVAGEEDLLLYSGPSVMRRRLQLVKVRMSQISVCMLQRAAV